MSIEAMKVSNSVSNVSLKHFVSGQDMRCTVVSSAILQQGQRLVLECCLFSRLVPIGRSFAISLVIKRFCLKERSLRARRILVQPMSC